jgi:hypothetical protein
MNGAWVEGRLFEEKSATWLYERVRLQFRPKDPGLLRVTDRGGLDLRVFPVGPNEVKRTRITVLHPGLVENAVWVDQHPAERGARVGGTVDAGPARVRSSHGDVLIAKRDHFAPSPRRRPVALLIFEHTAENFTPADKRDGWREALVGHRNGWAPDEAVVWLGNYEVGENLPARGGFDPVRAAMTALAEFERTHDTARFRPVVVFCGRMPEIGPAPALIQRLRELAPEEPCVLRWSGPFATTLDEVVCAAPNAPEVVTARLGGVVRTFPLAGEGALFLPFPGARGEDCGFFVGGGRWQGVTVRNADDPAYSRAVHAMFLARLRSTDPHTTDRDPGAWLNEVKPLGTLVPGLAFIAAETASQWKTLEATEQKKSTRHAAMEVETFPEAVPEPSTIGLVLLALLVVGLGSRRWRRG